MDVLTSNPGRNGARPTLVDSRALRPVLETIGRALGLCVTVCHVNGDIVQQACIAGDPLHAALARHTEHMPRLLAATEKGAARLASAGGAVAVALPITVEGIRVGALVSGPFWRRRPTPAQMRATLGDLGVRGGDPAALCSRAAVVTAARERDVTESLASLQGVIVQLCEERWRQQKTLVTLTTLRNLGEMVTSRLRLEEVLDSVLDGALALLHADEGSVLLLDAARTEMRIVASRGLTEDIVASTLVKMGEGVSGQVAEEGRARILRGGERDAASHADILKSALCVPLVTEQVVIGVLNIKGRQDGTDFTDDDLSLVSVMASQAAAAIANAQLYERARKRATEMGALFSIGTAINSELERNQVLQRVLDHSIELLDCTQGSIMLLNEETQELSIEVACGLSEEVVNSVRLRLGEGIAGRVAQSGKPLLLHKGEQHRESRSTREKHSALSVPLLVRERVTGVINISARRDGGDFSDEQLHLMVTMANQAAIAIENANLHDELHELFVSSITALANAIDARDPYTRGHSERVAVYAVRVGERVGLHGRDLDFLRYASLLHDVGKINIRDEILNKPGRLTDDEFQVMKRHPEYGAAIMMPVKAFQKIIPFMFYHHERYCSGGGYPVGLSGDAIPLEARIISVADAYDAMTSHRPYRRALSIDQAVQELIKNSGTQFDPRLVDLFLQILEEDPVFARSGIEASSRAEKEGWIRASVNGTFSPRGGPPVSSRPRIPSTG